MNTTVCSQYSSQRDFIQHIIGARLQDVVLIRNCPPISKRKRFKLETILKSPEMLRAVSRLDVSRDIDSTSSNQVDLPATSEAPPQA